MPVLRVVTAGLFAVAFGYLTSWVLTSALNPANADSAETSPSPSPVLPIASPSTGPLGPGQSYVTLSIYQVRLIVTDPIADLAYGAVDSYASGTRKKAAGFTTEALLAQYPLCKPGVLGTLYRKRHVGPKVTASPSPSPTRSPRFTPKPTPTPSPIGKNGFVKTIGDFDYYYQQPSYGSLSCAEDQFGRNALAEAKAAVINQALPSLSQ